MSLCGRAAVFGHSAPRAIGATQAEWLVCEQPGPMLAVLRGRASDRRFRLFACARCRSVLRLIPEGPCRDAMEVTLRFADGRTTPMNWPPRGRRRLPRPLRDEPIPGLTVAKIGECVAAGLWLEEGGTRRPLEPAGWVHEV